MHLYILHSYLYFIAMLHRSLSGLMPLSASSLCYLSSSFSTFPKRMKIRRNQDIPTIQWAPVAYLCLEDHNAQGIVLDTSQQITTVSEREFYQNSVFNAMANFAPSEFPKCWYLKAKFSPWEHHRNVGLQWLKQSIRLRA